MNNTFIDKIINDRNSRGIPDFEGYSPDEMEFILYDLFGEKSPIQLNKLAEPDYKKIPILNQIKFLAGQIDKHGELKLTQRGYLPPQIVLEVYSQRFIKEDFIDRGISKLCKESDSMTIQLTKILLELCGITKKRYQKLSLTRKGEKLLTDDHILLKHIITVFGLKFNWGYFGRYENDSIGRAGFGFSLVLLGKYGKTKQLDTFYAGKYFKAFPLLIDRSIKPYRGTPESYAARCYSLRTFDRFLDYFGLINIEQEKRNSDKYITKTQLFDKLIKCMPQNPGVI